MYIRGTESYVFWSCMIVHSIIEQTNAAPDLSLYSVFCKGSLPRRIYAPQWVTWGAMRLRGATFNVWSDMNFTSVKDLCAVTGNPEGNFGGIVGCWLPRIAGSTDIAFQCVSSVAEDPSSRRKLHFDLELARNVDLFDAGIFKFCKDNCQCANNPNELLSFLLSEAVHSNGYTVALPLPDPDPIRVGSQTTHCSARCTNFRCSPTYTRHGTAKKCSCLAKKVAPGLFIQGHCSVQALRGPFGKRRRDMEMLACPCNASYVSSQCCDTDQDGLVWENPAFKLGVMTS